MRSNENPANSHVQEQMSPQSPKETLLAKLTSAERRREICRKSKLPLMHALGAIYDIYVPYDTRNGFEALMDYVDENLPSGGGYPLLDESLLKNLLDTCCAKGTPTALLAKRLVDKDGLKKFFNVGNFVFLKRRQTKNEKVLSESYAFWESLDEEHVMSIEKNLQESPTDLSRDDLIFLYGFSSARHWTEHGAHARALLSERDVNKDMLIIFDCEESQIARSIDQIHESTKAYVGELEAGIFERLPDDVEHIYTEFPEGRVFTYILEIGGKTESELQELLKQRGLKISGATKDYMRNEDFTDSLREPNPEESARESAWNRQVLKSPTKVRLACFLLSQLKLQNHVRIDSIYDRIRELGLGLCPPEVGPQFRAAYLKQSNGERIHIGMEPDYHNYYPHEQYTDPWILSVERDEKGFWLCDRLAYPRNGWNAYSQFLFLTPKKETQKIPST
jgi:hypothetical protein